jgi:hypothetical protein
MILFTNTRKLYRAASAVLLSLLLQAGPAAAEIIPPDRTAPWQGNVGVPGGVPNRIIIWKNIVTDLGADPTGVADAAPIIERAILSCPAGQVVYMPAGTFRLNSNVHLNNKSNFTLRGAGPAQTILKSTNDQGYLYLAGIAPWPPPTNWIPITSGATKGSNTITIADTSGFAVDMLFTVGPSTPTWAHYLGGFADATNRFLGGQFKVRSKTSTTVTFDPPLPFDFTGMNPAALASGAATVQFSGFESFTVDLSGSHANWAFWITSAWGCWLKDIEIEHAYTRQTLFGNVARCEVRECYIHDAQAEGPNHEGLDFGRASWCLIEDNVFSRGGSMAVIFGDGTGQGLANVIAYNYVTNTTPAWWDISVNHGPHNMLNLIEGNVIHWYKDDGYFGSSSHNTLFRNRIDWEISLKHFCNYYNIVGNVLGTVGVNTVYESSRPGIFESSIYELGYPNIGNVSWVGTFGPTTPPNYSTLPNTLDGTQHLDLNVKATLLRHGNFDFVNNHTMWDPAIPDHTIPNSLYLPGKPSWWGVLPWPPIGPDRSPMVGPIPAQQRFANGMPTPPPAPAPTPAPITTACSQLQQRMDQLERRQQRLRQQHRSNRNLNQRLRRLRRQFQTQNCL